MTFLDIFAEEKLIPKRGLMQLQRAKIFDNSYELRSTNSLLYTYIYPLIIYASSSAKVSELKSWHVGNCLTRCIFICVSEVRSRGSQKKSRNCFSFANERIINCPEFLEIRFSREGRVARARGFFPPRSRRRREKSRRKNRNNQLPPGRVPIRKLFLSWR